VRRDVFFLRLPKRKGRHTGVGEEQDTGLWGAWKAPPSSNALALDDEQCDARSPPSILAETRPAAFPSSGRTNSELDAIRGLV